MNELPDGAVLVRTTPEFDADSVPRGLLRAHRVAAGVWGRLVVRDGSIAFGFDDGDDDDPSRVEVVVCAGGDQVIAPERPHHVRIIGPVRFVIEFHEPPVP